MTTHVSKVAPEASASGATRPSSTGRTRSRPSLVDWLKWRSATIPGEATGRLGLAVVAIALFALFSIVAEGYFTWSNVVTIGLTVAALLIAVTGTMFLLTAGTVDISIGAMFALVSVSVGQIAATTYNPAITFVGGLVIGAALGLANGVAVRLLKLNPLIVTIATMIIFGGLAFVVSGGLPIAGFPPTFVAIGRIAPIGLPIILIVAVVVFAIGSFVLTRTRTGLRIFAIGGDERAAAASGVSVARTVVAVFTFNGALVGLAATLVTARLGTAAPSLGGNFVFDVLTAAILGGIAFSGGGGRPVGVLVGVATIGILKAGLIFVGVPDFWQSVATGGMLLLALISDELLQKSRDAGGLVEIFRRGKRPNTPAQTTGPDHESTVGGYARERAAVKVGPVVLRAEGLRREFGAIRALRGVDLEVRAGEILCLLGDNGAGKSSLIKILSGLDKPDGGIIELNGKNVVLHNPQDAQRAGIRAVYQDLALVPYLSVAHNFVLGNEPRRRLLGIIPVRDEREAERRTRAALGDLGIKIDDLFSTVRRKSGGQRQALAIARATGSGAPVVILDEPTAALGVKQTQLVLRAIARLADRGVAVILITHDIKSVFAVADSVVVLRLGEVTHSGPISELDEHSLIKLMAGLT